MRPLEIAACLEQLPGWQQAAGREEIFRRYEMEDGFDALSRAGRALDVGERRDRDVHMWIHRGTLLLRLVPAGPEGLTEADFAVAWEIDRQEQPLSANPFPRRPVEVFLSEQPEWARCRGRAGVLMRSFACEKPEQVRARIFDVLAVSDCETFSIRAEVTCGVVTMEVDLGPAERGAAEALSLLAAFERNHKPLREALAAR